MYSKKTIFISDAHFGINLPGFEEREHLFFSFLDREAATMEELYIVGDLFDFWIEYKNGIRPHYFEILHHLKQLVDNGIKIHYLAGNHDFALGSFLKETIGISLYPGELSREIQDKRVFLYHGDGIIRQDIGYTILKKLLRNRFNQWIYRMIHPDIGVPLGSFISGSSRKYLNKPLPEAVRVEYGKCARKRLLAGHDIVLFGHIHYPELIRYPEGIYCNTGAWLKHYSYASMESGKISLRHYKGASDDTIVPEKVINTGLSRS